jgi:hypothetical protein
MHIMQILALASPRYALAESRLLSGMAGRRGFILALLVCFVGCASAAPLPLRVTETRIGTFPDRGNWRDLVVTTGGHVLFVIEYPEGTYTTYQDGKPIAGFDSVVYRSLIASPDNKRYAFFAMRAGKQIPVVDGVERPAFDPPPASWSWWLNHFYFSPDSRRVAYIGNRSGRLVIDVDGKKYTGGDVGGVVFSPDSQHIALFRRNPTTGGWSIDIDGVPHPEYPSPDGGTFVYSADERSTAYRRRNPDPLPDALVVVGQNARSYPVHGSIDSASLALGPAGKPLFWRSESEDKHLSYCDGQPIDPKGGYLVDVAFSPDGSRTAYALSSGDDHSTIVIDGVAHSVAGGIEGRVLFSPDSKRVACISREWASPPPHYFATPSRLWVLLFDQDGTVKKWEGDHFIFSPDSKHLLRYGEGLLAVDDREAPLHREDFPWKVEFDAAGKVRAVVVRGHEVMRLDISLE